MILPPTVSVLWALKVEVDRTEVSLGRGSALLILYQQDVKLSVGRVLDHLTGKGRDDVLRWDIDEDVGVSYQLK